MKVVIVLCGRRRVGKTTLARWFEASFGAAIVSITEPIRQITQRLYSLAPTQVDGPEKDLPTMIEDPDHGRLTPRDLMLRVSKAVKSSLGEDVWIDRAIASTMEFLERGNLVVVDGVRPDREVARFRTLAEPKMHPIYRSVGDVAVVVWKVECTTDLPSDVEDALDAEIDRIEPDFVVRAERDEYGLGNPVMLAALTALTELLQKRQELIPVFDPGGPDPDGALS